VWVATRPDLSPALRDAVKRARDAIAASGLPGPQHGPYKSPLSEAERSAVATLLRDRTYRQLADKVATEDPDIADL
jgi:hypothetical protein